MELFLYCPLLFFPGSGLSLPAHQKRSGIPIMVSGESSSPTANLGPRPEEGGGEKCACPDAEGPLWHFSKPESHPASSVTPSLPAYSISSYIRTVQRLCRRPSAHPSMGSTLPLPNYCTQARPQFQWRCPLGTGCVTSSLHASSAGMSE